MASSMVVELHPIRHEFGDFSDCLIAPQSQLLVFDASPKSLDKHVVHPAAFAVHADFNPILFDLSHPFRTRKLRSLIGIKYLGFTAGPLKRSLESSEAKPSVH